MLGSGSINHKVIIGAYDYSVTAYKKLKDSGCVILSIKDLVEKYPKGSGVKIIV